MMLFSLLLVASTECDLFYFTDYFLLLLISYNAPECCGNFAIAYYLSSLSFLLE